MQKSHSGFGKRPLHWARSFPVVHYKDILLAGMLMAVIVMVLAMVSRQAFGAESSTVDTPAVCIDGFAGPYPCHKIDLLSHLSIADLGGDSGTKGNDLWGWTDPLTNEEYVLMGLSGGTSFVNISDAANPDYLGLLPTHTISSTWRDIKVYGDFAYIVADRPSQHGMQVFDLTQLRSISSPKIFTETAHYDGFGNGHNLFVNEDTGFAYAMRTETCSGALHMIDLDDPVKPTFAGCFDDDGLTSDTQCVVYQGPDSDYHGREICFTGSDDAFTIGDVTDKSAPRQINRLTYASISRAHQGWLTEDQAYFLLSDTLDEVNLGNNTRTYLWNVSDLDNVAYEGFYEHSTPSIDHNVYISGSVAFEANFRAGLRVLDISAIEDGEVLEVAYFDVDPESDSPVKTGAWSSYPWFEGGVVAVSDTEQGLFILRLRLGYEPTNVTFSDLEGRSHTSSPWLALIPLSIGVVGLLFVWYRRHGQATRYHS